MERLQKIIAESGVCSRRKAEELIVKGKVSVNGQIVDKLGTKASASDSIVIDGKPLRKEEKVVFLFNKPKNVISSVKDDKGRKTVLDYINEPFRLYPLGRLDYDSTGLLLLTNDGLLTNSILHPKYKVEKVYEVTINRILDNKILKDIEKGVKIDNYYSSPCKIKVLETNNNKKTMHLLVTIYEGKNREIRKLFKTVKAEVIRLNRIKEANIELGNLRQGEYRKLKPIEIVKLKKFLNTSN